MDSVAHGNAKIHNNKMINMKKKYLPQYRKYSILIVIILLLIVISSCMIYEEGSGDSISDEVIHYFVEEYVLADGVPVVCSPCYWLTRLGDDDFLFIPFEGENTTTTIDLFATTTTTVGYSPPPPDDSTTSTTSTTIAPGTTGWTTSTTLPWIEDTEDLCSDTWDNDGDGDIDCLDSDCTLFCDCPHQGVFPECIGLCDDEDCSCSPMYTDYFGDGVGWCSCMPDDEIPCLGSYWLDGMMCAGWCEDGLNCIHDGIECWCSNFICWDSDDGFYPEEPGICRDAVSTYSDYCLSASILMEYSCSGDCEATEVDCTELYGGAGYLCTSSKFGHYCAPGEL